MAGIYLHIPFCKQACHYCDFHFSTSLKTRDALLDALRKEIVLQQHFLDGQQVKTIYFGGGTPSILTVSAIDSLVQEIRNYHSVADEVEITLEANPDDLSEEKLSSWSTSSINRLSIGIQSFDEKILKWMNRAHSAEEAQNCLDKVLAAGFNNFSIDLIYGIPTLSEEDWERTIERALQWNPPHISAYSLTVEQGTALAHQVTKGVSPPLDEQLAAKHFQQLTKRLEVAGYRHYEISNFCKEGFISQHNSSYWTGTSYLGLGPSAHSFNGAQRCWNVANNVRYIQSLKEGKVPAEFETLSETDRFNEMVMIGLRTDLGIDVQKAATIFGPDKIQHLQASAEPFIQDGSLQKIDKSYRLTAEGKLLADRIAAALFFLDS